MELIIILILIGIVIFVHRDYHFVVYLLGILEILFRLLHYIGDHLTFIKLNPFINKYIPTSLFDIVSKYTSGVIEIIFSWLLVAAFILLLVYLIKYLFKIK